MKSKSIDWSSDVQKDRHMPMKHIFTGEAMGGNVPQWECMGISVDDISSNDHPQF